MTAKTGRRCLVFGGSGALGRVVCETLAAQGARIAFTFRTGQQIAHDLSSRLPESVALPVDLNSIREIEETVASAARALDGIDAFVQCAGVSKHQSIGEADEQTWDQMMNVNARSTFFAVRHVVDIMRGVGGGNIVLIGSVDSEKLLPAPIHYGASKGALRGMMQTMAKEFGGDNVRVNLVAPGIMEEGMSKSLPDERVQEYLKHSGLKRLGKVSEIANMVAWLALHNTYITGQSIVLDGAL